MLGAEGGSATALTCVALVILVSYLKSTLKQLLICGGQACVGDGERTHRRAGARTYGGDP